MQEPTTAERDSPPAPKIPEEDETPLEIAPPIMEVRKLSKSMRGRPALRGVSITVRQGQVYGLLGAVGAGKSTLARLLLGFLHPDSGQINLFGSSSPSAARFRIGYLPQRARYHGNMSGRDYLRFQAGLGGLSGRDARKAASEATDAVGLASSAKRLIGGYSKEDLRRLGLAVALVSGGLEPPDLLIIDEPTAGLGEELGTSMREVLQLCREQGSTIFLCSQELTPVERLCTHVGILRAGRLLAQTPVDATPRANLVGLARDGAMEMAPALLAYLARVEPGVEYKGGTSEDRPLHVSLPAGPDTRRAAALKAAVIRAMVDARWDIVSVYMESRDLDSLYLQAVPASKEEEENKKAEPKAAITSPLAAASPVTSPLPSGASTSQTPEDESASVTSSGPSTHPLLGIAPDYSGTDSAATLQADTATQLEPRKLRDRSNGASPEADGVEAAAPGAPVAESTADTHESTDGYAALLRDRS